MSHELHVAHLAEVASEVEQAIEEKAYTVDLAMDVNDDFENPQARALLMRDLVVAAAASAAGRLGTVDCQAVNGTGRELRAMVGRADRRYRIKRACKVKGELQVRANSDSALVGMEDPEEAVLFGHLEQWVFGWHLDCDERVDEIFAARILPTPRGATYLNLGPRHTLFKAPPRDTDTTPRFDSGADEGLPGFDGDADDDLGAGWQ